MGAPCGPSIHKKSRLRDDLANTSAALARRQRVEHLHRARQLRIVHARQARLNFREQAAALIVRSHRQTEAKEHNFRHAKGIGQLLDGGERRRGHAAFDLADCLRRPANPLRYFVVSGGAGLGLPKTAPAQYCSSHCNYNVNSHFLIDGWGTVWTFSAQRARPSGWPLN